MVNKDLKKNSKIRTVNMMIQSALIIILIVLVANMMVEIKNLQGTARVINYAGVVVEILHRDSCENDEYMYGCRFVGMGAEDQFKIEAYQIVDTGSVI